MKKKDSRLAIILEFLRTKTAASIKELAEVTGVTEMTIRRDLDELNQLKSILLIQGVAVYKNNNIIEKEYSLQDEILMHKEEKRKIGLAAAKLIESGDIIFLDSGTTTESIVHAIPPELNLTFISNSLNIINQIRKNDNWELIVPGGILHRKTMMLENEKTNEFITGIRATKAFISTSGISDKLGVTCTNVYEIKFKKTALNTSVVNYIVTDSSKFNKISIAHLADLNAFNYIITDSNIPQYYIEYCNKIGIKLIIVNGNNQETFSRNNSQ